MQIIKEAILTLIDNEPDFDGHELIEELGLEFVSSGVKTSCATRDDADYVVLITRQDVSKDAISSLFEEGIDLEFFPRMEKVTKLSSGQDVYIAEKVDMVLYACDDYYPEGLQEIREILYNMYFKRTVFEKREHLSILDEAGLPARMAFELKLIALRCLNLGARRVICDFHNGNFTFENGKFIIIDPYLPRMA